MGTPDRTLDVTDEAWSWSEGWSDQKSSLGPYPLVLRVSAAQGDQARLAFTGTAIALVGHAGPDGGRAKVYVDDRLTGEIDSYAPERTFDNALWHRYGLPPGTHTLTVVTTGEGDRQSSGRRIAIGRAITYR